MITLAKAQEIQNTDIKTVQDAINHYQQTKSKDTLDFIFQMLIPYIYKTGQKRMETYDSKSLPFDTVRMLEEVTSSVTEKLLNHIMSFENQYFGSIYNWIKKVTNNEISDFFRAKKKELLLFEKKENFNADDTDSLDRLNIEHETNQTSTPDNPEQIYLSDELSDELSTLINKLSDKDRLIIYYKFQLEMKNEDIAQVMNVSLSTVAHGVKKAKEALATQVLAYEKKTGTRLHSVAIFEIIGILYYMSAKDAEVPESIYTKVSEQIAEHVVAEATKATGKEVVKRAIKKATDTVTKKIIIGVVTTTLVTGVVFSILQKPDNDTPSDAPIEDSTDAPISFDEPLLDLDDKTQARLSVITEYYWKVINPAPIINSSASNTSLSDESYIQILKDLIVQENILNRKTKSGIKMSQQELSDFLQHTLNYPRDVEVLEWDQFFTQDNVGKYKIDAGQSIGYERKWTFTSITQSPYFDEVWKIEGYAIVENERIEVVATVYKDASSLLNGYKIDRVSFSGEHVSKNDIVNVLKPEYVEELIHLGQLFWYIDSNKIGMSEFTLQDVLPIISKRLVVDNVLQKQILTDSHNQEYVLVSESELIDFTVNTFCFEPKPGEIDNYLTKNQNGEYIMFKKHYTESAKIVPKNIVLTHVYTHTDSPFVYVFSTPGNSEGTLLLHAERNAKSHIVGCAFFRTAHNPKNFISEDELIQFINEDKAAHDEWVENLLNEQ